MSGKPSTRTSKKRQARRQWLQAGRRCFARDGYDGAAVERIAAEAGLSRPGFFLYFASKAALRTAIRLECLHTLAMMASQEATREGVPAERLRRALERMAQWVQQEREAVRGCGLLASGLSEDETAEHQAWARLAMQLVVMADSRPRPAAATWVAALLRSAWQQSPIDIKKLGILLFAVIDAES